MPRLSRICSVLDCGHVHYAKGFCLRHYRAEQRRTPKRTKSGVGLPSEAIPAALVANGGQS